MYEKQNKSMKNKNINHNTYEKKCINFFHEYCYCHIFSISPIDNFVAAEICSNGKDIGQSCSHKRLH